MLDDVAGRRLAAIGLALLDRIHDDEASGRSGERRIERGIGEAPDVVEPRDAAREGVGLRLRPIAVDGDFDAVGEQRVEDGREAADFLRRRHGRGIRVAGGGTEIDDVGALRH